MRNLAELNLNDRGKAVERLPPSAGIVSAFEHEFNLSLPRDYLAFLTHSNGGHPELDSIAPMHRPDLAGRSVDHFFYLDEDRASPTSLWVAAKAWQPILGPGQLPIAVDGGGNPFVLDLTSVSPIVYACLHDEGFVRVGIAPTFGDFIDRLDTDPDMI